MATAAANRRYGGGTDLVPYYATADVTALAATPAVVEASKPPEAEQRDWERIFGHLESRFQALINWRVSAWETWGRIARFEQPYRYYPFITPNLYNQNLREDFSIVDRTATLCGEICAAGLMATLTDPDRRWLELGPAIPGIQLDREGERYYEDWSERLNYVYDHSNFYESQAQQYDDLTYFGNGLVIDYEDEREIIHAFTPTLGEWACGVNFDNGDDTMYREFRQTISQIVGMFGPDACPEDVLRMWREKGGALEYQMVIGHAIEPNFPIATHQDEPLEVVPGGFPWREVYWIRGKKNYAPLSRTGFHDQPFSHLRWSQRGNEAYGRGPGERALGDTIQLQLETRQKAEGIEKVNRPPMGADHTLQFLPNATSPGKITYMNTKDGGEKKFFPLFEVKPDLPAISADIKLVQDRIARTFYNDVFQVLMTLRQQLQLKADLTTVEIDQLTQEVLMRIGPMIWAVYGSLRHRVRRHMGIMVRRGLAPRRPDSLRNVPMKIEFVSLLTEAKRRVETQATAKVVQFAGAASGAWPEAKFKVKIGSAIEDFAEGVGAKSNLLRTDQEVQALIQEEKRNQALQQAAEQTLPGARAAEALSRTSLAPGSALGALVGQQ
jgi:head-to-tail connecting protein